MTDTKHRCPRRDDMFAPRFAATDDPAPDGYSDGHGLANSFAPGCTYCGSISGDDFMAFVRDGGKVDGSDKNYKVYLDKDTGTPSVGDTTVERLDGGREIEVHRVKPGTGIQHAKFYWQHLSSEQRDEFIALWNDKKVNHSLYVWPFFMSRLPS